MTKLVVDFLSLCCKISDIEYDKLIKGREIEKHENNPEVKSERGTFFCASPRRSASQPSFRFFPSSGPSERNLRGRALLKVKMLAAEN